MLWFALSTTLPFPYQYKCCCMKGVSILFPVCLVLSPLFKKHSNIISAPTSSRKMDWNKHCTAQLKRFLCPSARTHWTTELHDQPAVLWKSAASREQGNLRVWDLQGLLSTHDYFSFIRVPGDMLWVVLIWQLMPTFNYVVVLLWLAPYRDKPVYAFPLKWSYKLQIHFYAGCITYFSKEEHGFITQQICSTFSAARHVVTWTNLFTRSFWETGDEYKFGELQRGKL